MVAVTCAFLGEGMRVLRNAQAFAQAKMCVARSRRVLNCCSHFLRFTEAGQFPLVAIFAGCAKSGYTELRGTDDVSNNRESLFEVMVRANM